MTARRVNAYRALASASRVTLLDALQQRDGMTITELAEVSGLHTNTAREHLGRLIGAGFVTCEPEERHTRGRPRMLYRAVAGRETINAEAHEQHTKDALARAELTRMLLAGFGSGTLEDAGKARELGEAAAQQHSSFLGAPALTPPAGTSDERCERQQLDVLEDHFDQIGFEVDIDVPNLELHLRHCPFYDLARQRPEVVCRVHEGLAAGVLARVAGPLALEQIMPFVGPEHCIVHLNRRDADDQGDTSTTPVGLPPLH